MDKALQEFSQAYKDLWKNGKAVVPGDVRPEAEDPQWYLTWHEWVFGRYCNNYTLVCPGGYAPRLAGERSIDELRAYGRGMQPVEKYRSGLDLSKLIGPSGKKLGLVNISWDTNRVYRKFREIIIDRLMAIEHEPSVIAIDSPSLRKKNIALSSAKLASMSQSKAFYQAVGKTPAAVSDDVLTMTPSDVEVLNQLGGFQTAAEIALKEAALASLQFSNFDPEIKRQIIEDLVDLAMAATHIRHDAGTGRQVIEYVDPAGLIIPNSQYDDCRDLDYAGFVRHKTISQLRQESSLTESELLEIAKKHRNTGINSRFNVNLAGYENMARSAYAQRFAGNCPYDQFEVPVMQLYFVALDVERFVVGYRKAGNKIFDRVSRDASLNERDQSRGKAIRDNIVQYVYKSQWVVGSRFVFDYGIDDLVTREGVPGAMKATLPVVVHRCNQGSITGACVAAIDDLQLAIYKKRHALTVIPPPPNMAVDLAIMEDSVKLGGFDLDALDLAEIYSIKGYYFYHSKPEFADSGEASNRPPLIPLGDNTDRYLMALQLEIEKAIDNLRLISGVNEIADGSGNPQDVLNKVAAGMNEATNRGISNLYTACTSHYKALVKGLVLRYQSLAAFGERALHYLPVGSDVVRMIQLYPDFSLAELDIAIRPGIDGSSRQMLMQALISNRDQQKIGEESYLMVLQLLQMGNVQRANFVMAKAVAEKSAQDQQAQTAIMREQSAAQSESAVIVEDAKRKTAAMEGEIKAKQITLQGEETRKTEADKHNYRMKELQLEVDLQGGAMKQAG